MRVTEVKGKKLPNGIFFDDNKGKFGYRIKTKDFEGNPVDRTKCEYSNQTEAVAARRIALYYIKSTEPIKEEQNPEIIYDRTFEDVYNKYLENKAREKRPSTNTKHGSLWRNHIKPIFGSKKLVDVSIGDMSDYLLQLYRKGSAYNNYANAYEYGYVEGFLKFFYLIYGVADSYNWLPPGLHAKMFVNKGTKLTMPKMTNEDEEDDGNIVFFSKDELDKLDVILKDSNIYVSYLIGLHLGLRISECMGLRWSDIDWVKHKITINKQMQYQDYCFCLTPPKTKAGKRTLIIPDKLYNFLLEYKKQQEHNRKARGKGYKADEKILVRLTDVETELIGGDFIQRKEDGELITINSIKYWATKIKVQGIDFKFHVLRHTCASHLAALNVPKAALMAHMGHATTNITEQYYIATNELAEELMRAALDTI